MGRGCSKSFLILVLASAAFWLLSPQVAASQESAHSQFWPELDFFYRFDAEWRLFAVTSLTREREIQYTDWQIGAHLDFSFYPLEPLLRVKATDYERFRAFLFRAGYTYNRALGENSGDYLEHRGILEATLRIPVTELLLFSDKNRAEFRGVNGEFSFRYRNRVRVERQVETALVTFNPILSVEFYYDTRYEAWNRQLYTVGVEWTLSGGAMLETSYQRQNDSRASVPAINAFALTLSLYE